jgi:uncharacterized membrane protein YhaH (DUF805 family)
MTFTTAVRTCFQKYATFSGRARRSEFWWFQLCYALAMAVIVALIYATGSTWPALLVLPFVPPTISVTVRRLHDTSRSGWWYLISFVPYVGPVVLLALCCLDSAPSNQYGNSPKVELNATGYLQPGV